MAYLWEYGAVKYLWKCGTEKLGTGPPVTFDSSQWQKSLSFIVITLKIVSTGDFLTLDNHFVDFLQNPKAQNKQIKKEL